MKLYAATTSERATKGQGGEYITFELKDEKRLTALTLQFESDNGEILPQVMGGTPELLLALQNEVNQAVNSLEWDKTQGQEGNITCECGKSFYGLEGKEDTCPKCLEKIIKGEKKKDKCNNCGESFETLITFKDNQGKELSFCHDCAEAE